MHFFGQKKAILRTRFLPSPPLPVRLRDSFPKRKRALLRHLVICSVVPASPQPPLPSCALLRCR